MKIILIDMPKATELASAYAAVASAVISLFALYLAVSSKKIANRALNVANEELQLKKGNLHLYLVSGFKFYPQKDTDAILAFNVTVSNRSVVANSIERLELVISFLRNDSSEGTFALPHDESLSLRFSEKVLVPFCVPLQIEEKETVSKWCFFLLPSKLISQLRIDKYTIRLVDNGSIISTADAYLVTEVPSV